MVDSHPNSRLLRENEAAPILGVEVATLRRWRWAGKGPSFRKIGAAVRYDPADLHAFIAAAKRTSTSDPGPSAQVERVQPDA
jgi:predicted DNA-binding transcriptional regulator AlpA